MEHKKKSNYFIFGAMIATSMIAMFGLMYLNTYEISHVQWSETRFYMTFIMGAAMAVIMLTFMRGMYSDRRKNLAIGGLSAGAISRAQPDNRPGRILHASYDPASLHCNFDQWTRWD